LRATSNPGSIRTRQFIDTPRRIATPIRFEISLDFCLIEEGPGFVKPLFKLRRFVSYMLQTLQDHRESDVAVEQQLAQFPNANGRCVIRLLQRSQYRLSKHLTIDRPIDVHHLHSTLV